MNTLFSFTEQERTVFLREWRERGLPVVQQAPMGYRARSRCTPKTLVARVARAYIARHIQGAMDMDDDDDEPEGVDETPYDYAMTNPDN